MDCAFDWKESVETMDVDWESIGLCKNNNLHITDERREKWIFHCKIQ